jgi:hypothetical protein
MRHADHSCAETQEKIQLMMDGELDRHSASDVMDIIDRCPFCKDFYGTQVQFKRMLHVGLQRRSCGEQLKTSIVSRIRGM